MRRPAHRHQRVCLPYDPIHQTFINLYEDGALTLQAILDASRQRVDYYAGDAQGRWRSFGRSCSRASSTS